MKLTRTALLGMATVAATMVGAQSPFALNPTTERPLDLELGGISTVDIVILEPGELGAALKNGAVKRGSEQVDVNGRVLRRGVDYTMDYEAGVVYLMSQIRKGQVLRVSYRFEEAKARQGTEGAASAASNMAGLKFDLLQNGSFSMLAGFGATERTAEGSILRSNTIGFSNNFQLAGGALRGMHLSGDRRNSMSETILGSNREGANVGNENSRLTLQQFSSNFAGGTFEANYQDVSQNFSAFGQVRGAGYEQSFVDQLAKEKGLRRTGFAFNNVQLGSSKFTASFRNVEEAGDSIDWRTYGFESGGLQVNWNSQRVGQGFTRFKDISEADREQLQREAGLARENFAANFAANSTKIGLNLNQVENADGLGIYRRSITLESPTFKFNASDQEVQEGFDRFNSLFEAEKGQWGREVGMNRQNLALSTQFQNGLPNISYAFSSFKKEDQGFRSRDMGVTGNAWSLTHSSRQTDVEFRGAAQMSDAEKDAHIKSIAAMYAPQGINARPEDRGPFANPGLDRTFTKFQVAPKDRFDFSAERLNLATPDDQVRVDTVRFGSKVFNLNYRHQKMGEEFGDLNQLMSFERQQLGPISGLERTDFGFGGVVGGDKNFRFNQMRASSPKGDAMRQSVHFKDPRFEFAVNQRRVDETFDNVAQLVDPEKDLLHMLRGFSQQDAMLKAQIASNFKIDGTWFGAKNEETEETRVHRTAGMNWSPFASTEFTLFNEYLKNDTPEEVLFHRMVSRFGVRQDLGRFGKVTFVQEKTDFEGTKTEELDRVRNYLAYETKLDEKTSVKTEQTRTRFEDGTHEKISANSVSTEITKRIGISVTDVHVNRDGEERDERRRNYGFWYDLGNGLKIAYNYARQMIGTEQPGTLQTSLVTEKIDSNDQNAGTVGSLKVDQMSYRANRWDETRTQATGNVQISTAKPFTFGPLSNIQVNYSSDTAADKSAWQKENLGFGFSANIGKTKLAYQYRSQMHATQYRGIDRLFVLETDPDPKNAVRASLTYKLRTLPNDEMEMIRKFDIAVRPFRNFEIQHQVLTNPEQPNGNVLLGTTIDPRQSNIWKLNAALSGSATLGVSWDESMFRPNGYLSRTAGVNLDLFKDRGSPLSLFYGVEQRDGDVERRTIHKYHLRYSQAAGPNQSFAFYLGNTSFQHSISDGFKRNNWSMRLDYNLRFKGF